MRVAVLRELDSIDIASPRVLADRLGEPLGHIAYHVRTLRTLGLLEPSGTAERRGTVEHYYRLAPGTAPIVRAMLDIGGSNVARAG